ncbi:polyketide synthase, partial [Myxococcota bacterium]|nr:polyketide synthase [Myxococcota bacterium]
MEQLLGQSDEALFGQSVLFAGGIATRHASWFISGVGSLLAKRGMKVGIQVGTPYLFTGEIVSTGAITGLYQEVLLKRSETIVIGRTVGLASRTAVSPLSRSMMEDEVRLITEKIPLSERKQLFEERNIGSLLIGAKGYMPDFNAVKEDGTCELIRFNEEEHFEKGNFLTGDAIVFDREAVTIEAVHQRFMGNKEGLSENLNALEILSSRENTINDEIAIIGMGCILPDAQNPEELWENIVSGRYSIGEMPAHRFDQELYFSEDKKAMDKSYTKIAGHVEAFAFNAGRYGYTPEKAGKISRSQQMILETAYQAMASTGYLSEDGKMAPLQGSTTAVIIGTCLGNELGNDLHLKYYYPELKSHLEAMEAFQTLTPKEQQHVLEELRLGLENGHHGHDPVHGSVLNIEASRIAHHMGITGVNYVVDAACATSFAAIDCGIKELLSGNSDLVITGGVNTNLAPEPFVGFCKMGALSARGSFPFDERSDGFVLGEGAGVIVLKRMRDALRDKDEILSVIKAVGSSSDGKGKAIAAPKPQGQAQALRRCFAKMKTPVTFDDVDYIEAHGTSTVIGDQAELATIVDVYRSESPVGVSSIKSQIGHLLGGAGIAGMVKAIKAIQNKALPGNGGFEKLSPRHSLEGSSVYIIKDTAEWKSAPGRPRRAAVSSFGFGGINYHAVIEEFTPSYVPVERRIFTDPAYDPHGDRVVVVGVGTVLPGAQDAEKFWECLTEGSSQTSAAIPVSRFNNAAYAAQSEESGYRIPMVKAGLVNDFVFDNAKYRIPPTVARSIDRAQLFGLSAAKQAITQAGLAPHLVEGNTAAVILGTISGEYSVENVLRVRIPFVARIMDTLRLSDKTRDAVRDALVARLQARYNQNTEDTTPGLLSNIVTGRIANTFNCNGPNFVVDASCASSTVAIDLAVRGIRAGEYDFAITGGVDANLYPAAMIAFKRLSLLSEGECHPFDRRASGYIMGEGAAIQVLTSYKKAKELDMPILAELPGISFSSSVPAHLLSPSERSYREAISTCYDNTGISKNSVDYLDVD